jgi:hypothetical protein
MTRRVSVYSSRLMGSPEVEATVGRVILPTWLALEIALIAERLPRSGVGVVIRVVEP